MRLLVLAAVLALCFAPRAVAADATLTLRAEPVPVVDVEINGIAVRLEVDAQASDGVVMMNTATAQRLGLRPATFGRMRVGVDGGDAMLVGRVARPSIRFLDGRELRAVVGIFGVPVSGRADGVIGAGALPYDLVTVVLGPPTTGERVIVLPMIAPGSWRTRTQIEGRDFVVGFHFERPATVINRRASALLDEAGLLQNSGGLVQARAILGLTTAMQPVHTQLRVHGLALGTTLARVDAPLLGPVEEGAIVVTAPTRAPSLPAVFLGREALSRCSSMIACRREMTLTLHCAA